MQRPRLKILPTPKRLSVSRDDFLIETSPQAQLFPKPRHGLLIFIHFFDVTEQEFRETIEYARPSFVLELRPTPRFDVGRLNRQAAFRVFENQDSVYHDLTSSLMGRADEEAVIANLQTFLDSFQPSFERPVVFLLNRRETDGEFLRRILKTVTSFNSEVSEFYEVPRFLQS